MLNIIAFDVKSNIISTSNLHIFDMITLLINKYNYEKINIELLYKDCINDYLIKKYNKLPDNILIIKGSSNIRYFKTHNDIKISFIIDDVHQGGTIRHNRLKSLDRVTNIFNTYAYFFNVWYIKKKYNLYWMPHSTRFTDIILNKNPINKILITGRLNDNIYPNRKIIHNMSLKDNRLKYFKSNVGYRINKKNIKEKMIFGKKYLLLLNKYLCCFTCDANINRPYLVAKHFEIMASGSLLLSCNPNTKKYFKMLGYIDMKHYISCNNENMIEKINFILDEQNIELINKIRENGYLYTIKNHNYEKRTEFLN